MAIPYQVIDNVLENGFCPVIRNGKWASRIAESDIYRSPMYSTALVTNISSEKNFFVPVYMMGEIIDEVSLLMSQHNTDFERSYLKPLTIRSADSKRTSSAILNMTLNMRKEFQLVKIQSTNAIYLGGSGLILREDFTPMIMWGHTFSVHKPLCITFISEPTVYIHPSVFTKDDVLSKYIAKNVVPLLASSKIHIPYDTRLIGRSIYNVKVDRGQNNITSIRVIVEDFSHMLYRPEPPKTLDYSENIKDRLIDLLAETNDN